MCFVFTQLGASAIKFLTEIKIDMMESKKKHAKIIKAVSVWTKVKKKKGEALLKRVNVSTCSLLICPLTELGEFGFETVTVS